jgi:hypothetical protein
MKTTKNLFLVCSITILLSSCGFENFKETANQQFGDQHFKTAIALIELHKIRYGSYPETLDSIKYTGDWDGIASHSVKYTKLSNGYELDLVNGWAGKPENLRYPADFWQGLGLQKSNLKQ